MQAVCRGAVAHDLGIDLCVPFDRPVVVLEHDQTAPLAADQPVAVPVKGPRRLLRPVVVFRRGREQNVKGPGHRRVQFLGAAAEEDVLPPEPDQVVARADGMERRCAGRGRRHDRAVQTQVLGHVHRGGVRHALKEHGRVQAAQVLVGQHGLERIVNALWRCPWSSR